MWSLVQKHAKANLKVFRAYSLSSLTPSELRFKEKLEEADRQRQKNAPEWEKRELSLRKRYGDWNPTRKLSRLQMNDIRDLAARAPELKTVQIADFFKINPESIRRILKSNWKPSEQELARQEARAEKRKQESLQRKLAEKAELKKEVDLQILKPQVAQFLAVKKKSPPLQVKNYKYKHHNKRGTEKPAVRRPRTPYTQGVGDLID